MGGGDGCSVDPALTKLSFSWETFNTFLDIVYTQIIDTVTCNSLPCSSNRIRIKFTTSECV